MMTTAADSILILGCGYLGSALARRLLAEPADRRPRITGTTTTPSRRAELAGLGVTPLVLALTETARLAEALAHTRVAYLTIAPGGGRHGSYRDVYVGGVGEFLAALPDTLDLVVYTSSTSVYGQDDGSWVDEQSPAEPTSDGGRALREAEQLLLDGCAARGVPATVLRLTGIWADDRGPHRLAARLAGAERDDGEAFLNLVHRDDAAAALAALRHHRYHGVLNLNDDTPTTRRAFYDPLLAAAGLAPIRWRPSAVAGKRVSNAKLKALIGLELLYPRHDADR